VAIIPLYADICRTLSAVPAGEPVWPRFAQEVFFPHRAFFEGLAETYGPEVFGPGGLPAWVEQMAPALRQSLVPARFWQMEAQAQYWLEQAAPWLPGTSPNLYLGTLLYMAPAATLSVLGRPAIALGLERFHLTPPAGQTERFWYHPAEVAEMIPHEAAHVARMQALALPPTPRRLTLLDMVMLEGTALTFTDLLLGRETLATFLPAHRLAWHKANDSLVRDAAAADFQTGGMAAFHRYFSPHSPVSGYYVGYSLCREYLDRCGNGAILRLIGLPSATILAELGYGDLPGTDGPVRPAGPESAVPG
jgi:uncharacterized protein YjaZ